MHKKLLKTFVAVTAMVGVLSTSMVAFAAEDYTVQSGDSLKKIAKQSYGDETKWEVIYEANKGIIKNPNLIYKGQVFLIPDLTDTENTAVIPETPTNETVSYQQPEETVGLPLQADFEKYGIICNAELNTPYTYIVPDYDTSELTATGVVTFSDYEIFASDDTHEAVDGYEWRAVTMTIILQNGRTAWTGSDYYNIAAYDAYDENADTYTVNYNGKTYSKCAYDAECLQDNWEGDTYTWQWRVFFRVPKGYDGRVIYVYTPDNMNNGEYITDRADANTVIFRLQ